jgi:molybdate transport system substrate-binding protein
MRKLWFIVSIILLLRGMAPAQITVACAANMQFAMDEIKTAFEKTGAEVKTIYGSSGKLVTQIRSGAPFDIFVSADMDFPETLFVYKLAIEKPRVYAFGKVVLWTLRNDLDPAKGPALLTDQSIKAIALADPKKAPYGREAVKAMKKMGIYDQVAPRLVYADHIMQAAQFISTRAVDIGFCAKSIVMSDQMKNVGTWAEIDSSLYDRIAQGAVVLRYGDDNNPTLSAAFYKFLFGKESRAIMAKYGYILP